MTANTTILKIGNSSGVIIPAAIMKSLSLSVRDRTGESGLRQKALDVGLQNCYVSSSRKS